MKRIAVILAAGVVLVALWLAATITFCGGGPCVQARAHALAIAAPTQVGDAQEEPGDAQIRGLAILGDSTQDEYRADSARGGDFGSVTFNWVELLEMTRGINLGQWGTYGEPRRSGFAFNWARSGATSAQLLGEGQLAGALKQARAGEVSHCMVQIGLNDFYFSGLGLDIYQGKINGDALLTQLDRTARNAVFAAVILQDIGHCHVTVAAVPDYIALGVIPELHTVYNDPAGLARAHDAFLYVNSEIQRMSEAQAIPYLDYNTALLAELTSRMVGEPGAQSINVGGTLIDLSKRGNDPHFGMLDDEYAHPGTVLSALAANVYLAEINHTYGTSFALLSDDEILQAAGIRE